MPHFCLGDESSLLVHNLYSLIVNFLPVFIVRSGFGMVCDPASQYLLDIQLFHLPFRLKKEVEMHFVVTMIEIC